MNTNRTNFNPTGRALDLAGNPRVDRRRFLSMLGSAGALGAAGCSSGGLVSLGSPSTVNVSSSPGLNAETADRVSSDRVLPAPNGDRQLVVIELQGGNDGLAMLQPYDDGRLRSIRPDLMAASGDLHEASRDYGWHPNLSRLSDLGMAGLVGVGSNEPDFSHFEMEQRWWRGDSRKLSRATTGFFGRLCDELDVGDPITGASFSGRPTPALLSDKAVTVGLGDPGSLWFFRSQDVRLNAFREAVAAMGEPAASDRSSFDRPRRGLSDTTRLADAVAGLEVEYSDRYPSTELGNQLRTASQMLQLDTGVRVMHTQLSGFDTHTGQPWRYDQLMNEIDEAVTVFVDDLREQGQLESTLLVTTSEFGRRAEQNDGGTDHGGASTMMLLGGPGLSGIHGDAPNLASLNDGNVVATARFEDYYATIAEDWFGIPASEVLPTGAARIPGLLA